MYRTPAGKMLERVGAAAVWKAPPPGVGSSAPPHLTRSSLPGDISEISQAAWFRLPTYFWKHAPRKEMPTPGAKEPLAGHACGALEFLRLWRQRNAWRMAAIFFAWQLLLLSAIVGLLFSGCAPKPIPNSMPWDPAPHERVGGDVSRGQ